jgi:hydroxymethylpyrimidine pyrophosphatase-like HAD family hydrolase
MLRSGSRAGSGAVGPEWDGRAGGVSVGRRDGPATARVEDDAIDLLLDFDQVVARLQTLLPSADQGQQLFDAFLLAAAAHQMVADHIDRGGGVRSLGRLGVAVRTRLPRERALVAWESSIAGLVRELARGVVRAGASRDAPPAAFLARAGALPEELRRSVVRLPHCFRSFDMHPDDCRKLVSGFSDGHPDRAQPLLVVGLRTAGGYLGPLCAAVLEEEGYSDVETITLRPGRRWPREVGQRVAAAISARRHAVVVDEPPRTGKQLTSVARELEAAGLPRGSLSLLVPLFGSALPAALRDYDAVALDWPDWTVHRNLRPGAVEQVLDAALRGRTVTVATDAGDAAQVVVGGVRAAEPLQGGPDPRVPRRGHVTAAYRVELVDAASGQGIEHEVCVEGAGLGYLGRHALSVARGVAGFVPEVYALRDGLLYRAWLPDGWRLSPDRLAEEPALAERLASYVRAREQALAVEGDTSQRLAWREPVWEFAARLLASAFGRAEVLLLPVASRAARRLLVARKPAVVDGSMDLSRWYAPPSRGHEAQKVDFALRAFSNEDRYCYDPIFDLAGAAAGAALGPDGENGPAAIRHAYEQLAGEAVPAERWLVYQLLHHWETRGDDLRRFRDERGSEAAFRRLLAAERAMSSACLAYLREGFPDQVPPTAGPLCAIDVDWVLEARWLFFPAPAPQGMLAVRALAAHGYRPVIASGRSLGEVRERCAGYGMAGGVAEYGAAVYDHLSGRERSLLEDDERVLMDELRTALRDLPGVFVDPAYRHAVRAYRVGGDGMHGLDPDVSAQALERAGAAGGVRTIHSDSQTDFVPARIDKGVGLSALAGDLGAEGDGSLLALAVGDSAGDLPMLALAERRFAPANAEAILGSPAESGVPGIEIVSGPAAAGLLQAVAAVVGHDPAGCNACRPPGPRERDARLLHAVLAATACRTRDQLRRALELAAYCASAR